MIQAESGLRRSGHVSLSLPRLARLVPHVCLQSAESSMMFCRSIWSSSTATTFWFKLCPFSMVDLCRFAWIGFACVQRSGTSSFTSWSPWTLGWVQCLEFDWPFTMPGLSSQTDLWDRELSSSYSAVTPTAWTPGHRTGCFQSERFAVWSSKSHRLFTMPFCCSTYSSVGLHCRTPAIG